MPGMPVPAGVFGNPTKSASDTQDGDTSPTSPKSPGMLAGMLGAGKASSDDKGDKTDDDSIVEQFMDSSQALADAMRKGAQKASDAVHDLQEHAKDAIDSVATTFRNKRQEYKEFLEKYMKIKLRSKVIDFLGLIPDFIKKQMKDPMMPKVVERTLHRGIDTVWPDVKAELIWEIQVMLDGSDEKYEAQLVFGTKPDCFRAFFRYHLFPYDRGLWYCLRDPIWVIINILGLIPYYGIYVVVYAFIWLIIDKTDEYQLIYYILSFKGAQFFSWGLLKGIVGFSMYFYCVTFPPVQDLVADPASLEGGGGASCAERGPGMSEVQWVTLLSWVVPLVLCWVSMFLLPFSEEKGRSRLSVFEDEDAVKEIEGKDAAQVESEAAKATHTQQGGYLRKMLIFDFFIFILCVGLMGLVIYLQPDVPDGPDGTPTKSKVSMIWRGQQSDWQVKQTLFFCQFLYGLASIVFVPFVIPFLQAVLTHSAPTAYNSLGQCCKFKGPDKEETTGKKDRKVNNIVMKEDEEQGVFANLTNIAMGKKADVSLLSNRRKNDTGAESPTSASSPPPPSTAIVTGESV